MIRAREVGRVWREDGSEPRKVPGVEGVTRGLLRRTRSGDDRVDLFDGHGAGEVQDREMLAGGVVVGLGEDLDCLLAGEGGVVFAEESEGVGQVAPRWGCRAMR